MQLYATLADLLADARGSDRSIRFIDGADDESVVTFAALWDQAIGFLGSLQQRGLTCGDEMVIFTRSNEKFVVAFWAAILGGLVPVPVAVGIGDEHRLKLFRILLQLQRVALCTDSDLLDRLLELSRSQSCDEVARILDKLTVLTSSVSNGGMGMPCKVSPDDIAFIQYSSGSTREPKGVCLSHRNLCINIRALVERVEWHDQDSALSWMPLTHDMGLIAYHLCPLAAGMNHAIMDTGLFVRRPLLWMIKTDQLRATQLCSPNFGYKHFLSIFARKVLPDLDLSCVTLITNGAEPISFALSEAFLDALAPYGLKKSSMFPVYGLAEATIGVAMAKVGDEFSKIIVNRHALKIGDSYESVATDNIDAVSFVKIGSAIRDVQLRIADNADSELDAGKVGHVQVLGASVARRIYGDASACADLFTGDGWLRTGDCGVIVDGKLVVTGRSKDIIIVNGQNYYPHDIEEIASRVSGLDLGKVVVAGSRSSDGETEELLVFVLYRQDIQTFPRVVEAVRASISGQTGLAVDHVIPVSKIPKTTSGKIQRAKLLDAYLDGEYDAALRQLSFIIIPAEVDADPRVAELETIAKEIVKTLPIGPDVNLFEAGLDSLELTEIILAIEDRHPGKFQAIDVFDHPTLRGIADFIAHRN